MNLKSVATSLLCLTGILGCTKYQYFTVSSDLPLSRNPSSFVFDSDTLKIVYQFLGERNIHLEVTNKSPSLLFVDWSKSSMIFGDESLPFIDGEIALSGSINVSPLTHATQIADLSGNLLSLPARRYIPPGSGITHMFQNNGRFFRDLSTLPYEKVKLLYGSGKKYTFLKSDSVAFLRSYLYISDENERHPYILQHDFWVAEVLETLNGTLPVRGNQFLQSKLTDTGNAAIVIGVIGLGAIYIASDLSDEED